MKTMKFCPVFLFFYALNVAFMMLNYNTVLTKTQGVSLEGGKKRKKKGKQTTTKKKNKMSMHAKLYTVSF